MRASLPAPEESCDDLRVMVDKENSLPGHYVPRDLVSLDLYGVPNRGGLFLRREAAAHLSDLMREARKDGRELIVASAFRSYVEQRAMFAEFSFAYGKGADVVSARPGHSQHQLGTAVDFTNAAVGYKLLPSFGVTKASRWLLENAPEHGFVLAYPNSAERETGIQWEPWHYRYIGVENAERLQKSGLSLHRFLERENVRPGC